MSELEEEDALLDENLRETVSTFEAPGQVEGWNRIEESLNVADKQFDEEVRHRINAYKPEETPSSWPHLISRISGPAMLRSKIIAFKVVEVTAVLLLLFTVLKMGQMGKLPFETPLFDNPDNTPQATSPKVEMAEMISPATTDAIADNSSKPNFNTNNQFPERDRGINSDIASPTNPGASGNDFSSINNQKSLNDGASSISGDKAHVLIASLEKTYVIPVKEGLADDQILVPFYSGEPSLAVTTPKKQKKGEGFLGTMNNHAIAMASFMSSHLSPIQGRNRVSPPEAKYIRPRSGTHTEFGIITQLDYNKMRMPEDRLYSAGRQIIFPQQGLPTASIGGGFSFAIGHPRWAIETGMIYNPKTFKPGRQLIVGGAFDNGSVEFEAMRLQMISVPLQFRYRFDHKGFFKAYGLAGFGLHLIAQSDVDVLIKYHFPSLSYGQDPNNVPQLAEIYRETRRISEHIRDGAPFSTKSYFSVNVGAGVEYSVSENKTIFLQSTLLYQVPNLTFSNNNGKHIRSMSLQAGVRTPLGH